MKTGLECGGTRRTIPFFELATTIAVVAVKMTAVNICKERVWSVCGGGWGLAHMYVVLINDYLVRARRQQFTFMPQGSHR